MTLTITIILALIGLLSGAANLTWKDKPRWVTKGLYILLVVYFVVVVGGGISFHKNKQQEDREKAMAKAREAHVGTLENRSGDLPVSVSGEVLPDIEIGNGGTIFHSLHPEGGSLVSLLFGDVPGLPPGLPKLPPDELSKVAEENYLIAAVDSGQLKVSAKLVSRDGSIIVKIINNEWETNVKPISWDRNYSSDALEVMDGAGDVVLQLRMLPDRVQCQGKFYASSGAWGCVLSNGQGSAFFSSVPQNPNPHKCDIKPMFKYPSNLHFGELQ